MRGVFLVLLSLLTVTCGRIGTHKLSWSADTVSRVSGQSVVDLVYPVAIGGAVADSLNRAICDVIKFGLSTDEMSTEDQSIIAVVDTLLAQKDRDTVIRRMPYEITSSGSVFERDRVISVSISKYMYMGGAHGIMDSRYLNFDQNKGSRLSVDELFTDTTTLSCINTIAFKSYLAKKDIANVESLLFVDLDKLPLPKNIGLDSTGVVMLYNQYEIAPYSFGQSCYTIPYADVDKVLKDR